MRAAKHPIETFRTAPVQISGLAINAGFTALLVSAIEASEGSPLPTNALEATGYLANIGMGIINGIYAGKNIALRNRIETSLDKNGLNERALSTTTESYCARQAVRVACENYGVLPEYESVCEKNAAKAKFKWVPHI